MTWLEFYLNVLVGILSGVLGGMMTAGVLAWFATIYNRRRDAAIEQKLKEQFFPKSFVHSIGNKHGMPIENTTGSDVTIRSFCLLAKPKGPGGDWTIAFQFDPEESDKVISVLPNRWVTMPPFTKGQWNAPDAQDQSFAKFRQTVERFIAARVVIEYKTLLGESKLVTIEPPHNSRMQELIAQWFNQIFGFEQPPAKSSVISVKEITDARKGSFG